jgi:hypothetical protein
MIDNPEIEAKIKEQTNKYHQEHQEQYKQYKKTLRRQSGKI